MDEALNLLVLQPTPFCNIDCDYCYLPNRDDRRRMSPQVLDKIFERVFAWPAADKGFTIVWHAGEPMAVPVAFYREATRRLEARRTPAQPIRQTIQTNGTLITPEWCAFFIEAGFDVGMSIDGPAELHDRHRRTRSGGGTHARALRGLELLRRHSVPFHVITVLTRRALEFPDELYDFYRAQGVQRVGFNIEEIEDFHHGSSLAQGDAEQAFRRFLRRFLARVSEDGWALEVREFREAAWCLAHPQASDRLNDLTRPLRIVSIDCEGNFSTFSPEMLGADLGAHGRGVFGNVFTDSFADMAANPGFRSIDAEIRRGVDRCQAECRYFAFCGGGAPGNKFFENGSFDSGETLFCRLTKQATVDIMAAGALAGLPAATPVEAVPYAAE